LWKENYISQIDAAVGKMRGRGYKATPQRLTILRALVEEPHQSMWEIRQRCPEVGMVTVYRTLDLLTDLGIVRRMELGDGPRYELADDHHHHLVCESCGDISEFDLCPLDPNKLLPESPGFKVRSHSVEVYGRCAACN
jgi:Fur family ferric uptake transcriptional regulator